MDRSFNYIKRSVEKIFNFKLLNPKMHVRGTTRTLSLFRKKTQYLFKIVCRIDNFVINKGWAYFVIDVIKYVKVDCLAAPYRRYATHPRPGVYHTLCI